MSEAPKTETKTEAPKDETPKTEFRLGEVVLVEWDKGSSKMKVPAIVSGITSVTQNKKDANGEVVTEKKKFPASSSSTGFVERQIVVLEKGNRYSLKVFHPDLAEIQNLRDKKAEELSRIK